MTKTNIPGIGKVTLKPMNFKEKELLVHRLTIDKTNNSNEHRLLIEWKYSTIINRYTGKTLMEFLNEVEEKMLDKGVSIIFLLFFDGRDWWLLYDDNECLYTNDKQPSNVGYQLLEPVIQRIRRMEESN